MLVLSIDLRSTSTFAIKCWQTSGKSQWKHPELHQCRHRMLDRVQVLSMVPGSLFSALWQPASPTETLSKLRIHRHTPSSTCNHTTSTGSKTQTKWWQNSWQVLFFIKGNWKNHVAQGHEKFKQCNKQTNKQTKNKQNKTKQTNKPTNQPTKQTNNMYPLPQLISCPPFSHFQPPNPLFFAWTQCTHVFPPRLVTGVWPFFLGHQRLGDGPSHPLPSDALAENPAISIGQLPGHVFCKIINCLRVSLAAGTIAKFLSDRHSMVWPCVAAS